MIARRRRVFYWVAPLVVLSWLTLALLDPDPPGPYRYRLGYLLGSLFAHATLAAAWAALGPGPLRWRLPLSLAWVGSLPIAIGITVNLHGGPNDAPWTLGGCLLGQWLVLQVALWGLALGVGLQLLHNDDLNGPKSEQLQFGIRQLLVITAIVAVLFGSGRLVLTNLPSHGEIGIFLFLAVAAIILTIPLLLATLMRRWFVLGVLLSLLLLVIASLMELPLAEKLGLGGPDMEDFNAINVSSAGLTFLFALLVRLNGYCLYLRSPKT